ncbi:sigma-70 family RNA polymerase sigma factor [Ktedonosporobacter rubrisoli]|uniref:Sigma-70 family RNA polymerase sigma factor n=1 Tax=Ktedonosporobacter rubrisoli TaxID=2509675 RepID=A0A4P6K064_KTERU|nr:sigma-70 family RNA polymerase sigma factor [Ktedonosporobacter rubrisoli]QBD81429.1 sigma-70 family RNA polymerase sigma factor [Ktedonosporobacter rubrisoli]
MDINEAELAAGLAIDTYACFPHLVQYYQHRLYSFALRLCGNTQDAEDIVQEAFTRAYASLLRYTPERLRALRLGSWLYKITLNVFRQRARVPQLYLLPLDLDEDGPAVAIEDEDLLQPGSFLEHKEHLQEQQEALRLIEAGIAQLPERYRVVLTCYYLEQLSYQEIATLLEQPLGTVKSAVFRGLNLLRTKLRSQQPKEVKSSWHPHKTRDKRV